MSQKNDILKEHNMKKIDYLDVNFTFSNLTCNPNHTIYIYIYIYTIYYILYIYIYIYIYIWYSFLAKIFLFHIESWPEWDSNQQPPAHHAHALTTELSGRTTRCA